MVNRKTGIIAFEDSIGFKQTSSPVVTDINGDSFDEAILSIKYYTENELLRKSYHNMLLIFDFRNKATLDFGLSESGINYASTPWLGELDNNGLLDIVHCSMADSSYRTAAEGLKINRMATDIQIISKPEWGAYIGSNYDGIFKQTRLKK